MEQKEQLNKYEVKLIDDSSLTVNASFFLIEDGRLHFFVGDCSEDGDVEEVAVCNSWYSMAKVEV